MSVGIQTDENGPRCIVETRDLSLLDGTTLIGKVMDPLGIIQMWVDLTEQEGNKVGIPDVTGKDSYNELDEMMRTKGQVSILEGVGRLGVPSEDHFEEEASLEAEEDRIEDYTVFLPNKCSPCPICGEFRGTISKLYGHLQIRHKNITVHFSCQ